MTQLNDIFKPGNIVIYVDEIETYVWQMNCCTVGVFDSETGVEVDCWNFETAPKTIDEAVKKAQQRAEMASFED